MMVAVLVLVAIAAYLLTFGSWVAWRAGRWQEFPGDFLVPAACLLYAAALITIVWWHPWRDTSRPPVPTRCVAVESESGVLLPRGCDR